MPEQFDPWFTFAHDYSSHRYDCPIAEGGMANILECTCGYAKALAEAEAFVRAAEARVEAAEQALRWIYAMHAAEEDGTILVVPQAVRDAAGAALALREEENRADTPR